MIGRLVFHRVAAGESFHPLTVGWLLFERFPIACAAPMGRWWLKPPLSDPRPPPGGLGRVAGQKKEEWRLGYAALSPNHPARLAKTGSARSLTVAAR
jgi:hypothetical protein